MSLTSLLGDAQSWNVSLVLLLVKATLILIAALGITLAMQRASAGARHLVWLVTLGALVLIPALTAWGPLRLEILPARVAPPSVVATHERSLDPVGGRTTPLAPLGGVAPAPAESSTTAAASTGILDAVRGASLWSVVIGAWAAVALAIVLSLVWSALTVRRLVRRSRALVDQSWLTPLWEVSDRLGLTDAPRLLLSHDAKMPFACGLLQPTIVLPAECESWSHDRRLAVLLHELAHVRRRDMMGHTLGRLVCAVYWFHPLVWTAARQLRSESERACDDLALACGTRATDYAEHLLDIVTSVRRDGTPIVALAMARRKEFEGRMLAILDPELRHSTPSRRQSTALIATLAVISVVVGAAAPAPRSAVAVAVAVAQQPAARQERAEQRRPDSNEYRAADGASVLVIEHGDARIATLTGPAAHREAERLGAPTQEQIERFAHQLMNELRLGQEKLVPLSREQIQRFAERTLKDQHIATDTLVSLTREQIQQFAKQVRKEQRIGEGAASGASSGAAAGAAAGAANGAIRAMLSGHENGPSDERAALLAKVLRSDSSASLRRVAAWGLHEYAEQSVAAEALGAALRRDANEEVREMAAWSLGQGDDKSVGVEALRAALHSDASVAVRRTAAWAIGAIGDEGSVSTLVDALKDASAEVRARAIWALGNVEHKQAPKALLGMLSDKDARVRELTAWALYQIEDEDAAPALQAALRTETDKELQLSYIRALAALGDKSVDAVRGLLESSDPRIRSMAVHALAGGHASGPWPRPMPQPRPYP